MASIDNRVIYENSDKWNFLSVYYPENKSGHMYVSKKYKDSYESTVENLESTMLGHEWYSHMVKDYGDEKYNHWMAYFNSIHFNFFKTTDKYKSFNRFEMDWYQKHESFFKLMDKLVKP